MNAAEYLVESERTAAGKVHWDKVRTSTLATLLSRAIDQIEPLDAAKKSLFYGREFFDPSGDALTTHLSEAKDVILADVLHAVLGVITEASEMAELLLDAIQTGVPPERARLQDESGDVLWYLALLYRTIGTDFDTTMALNIEKLRIRFPEKFETRLANHRDDAKEQAVFNK